MQVIPKQIPLSNKTMTTTLTPAEVTRLSHQLCTSQGLPPLPHIPANFLLALNECQHRRTFGETFYKGVSKVPNVKELGGLTPEQQEANLLHVALWIVERDRKNLHMEKWHKLWFDTDHTSYEEWTKEPSNEAGFHTCGTTHCLAGFAQVMGGLVLLLSHLEKRDWYFSGRTQQPTSSTLTNKHLFSWRRLLHVIPSQFPPTE